MSIKAKPWEGGASATVPDASEAVKGKIQIATSAEATTGTNDLKAMTPLTVKERIDAALVGGVEYKGIFNVTTATPDLSNAEKGDMYIISGTGALYGKQWVTGDHLLINDDMGGSITNSKIDKVDNTDQVTSVNGLTGAVLLSADDMAADHSANNYTPSNTTIEGHLSGVDSALGTKQPLDAGLTSISGLTTAADKMIYTTGSDTYAVTDLTSAGRALLDDASASDQRTTLGLGSAALKDAGDQANEVLLLNGSGQIPAVDGSLITNVTGTDSTKLAIASNLSDLNNAGTARTNLGLAIGSDVQAHDAGLDSISGLTTAADKMIYTTGSDTYAVTDLTSAGRALLDDADAATQRTTLGLAIGSDVQAHDAGLDSISGLTTAADKMIYTTGSDTYAVTGLTSAGRALLDDADATAQQATLGLGTAATQDVGTSANNVVQLDGSSRLPAVDGSQLTGITATDSTKLAIASNLSDLNNAGTARTNLGLAIGSDVQAHDAGLDSISGLTTAADKMIYTTGSDTYAVTSLTSAGRALLDDADATAQQATLGLGTAATKDVGTSANNVVQLDGSSRLPAVDGSQLTGITATDSTKLAIASNLSDLNNAGTARTNLGLAIGSDVQAHDAGLDSISGLTTAADKMIYTTGSDTYAVTSLTSAGRALLDDADAAAQRTTLGLVIGTDVLGDVVDDTTPQLGGDLDVNGQDISTVSGNAKIGLKPHGTGFTELIGNTTGSNNPGSLRFNCEQNTHGVIVKSPLHSDYDSAGDYTLTLPTGLPASDKVLQSSSTGVLSWVAQSGGGSAPSVTTDSSGSNTTISTNTGIEEVHLIDNGANNVTITIPAASTVGAGYKYQVKRLGTGTVSVAPSSGTIDAAASFSLASQYDSVTLLSDNSNYHII